MLNMLILQHYPSVFGGTIMLRVGHSLLSGGELVLYISLFLRFLSCTTFAIMLRSYVGGLEAESWIPSPHGNNTKITLPSFFLFFSDGYNMLTT
jgi:hypothetical protein